jgi:hypothetical protein
VSFDVSRVYILNADHIGRLKAYQHNENGKRRQSPPRPIRETGTRSV